jgi:hypothetical protein
MCRRSGQGVDTDARQVPYRVRVRQDCFVMRPRYGPFTVRRENVRLGEATGQP